MSKRTRAVGPPMPAALYGKKEEKKKRRSIRLYHNTPSNIVLYANPTLTLRYANVSPTQRAARDPTSESSID